MAAFMIVMIPAVATDNAGYVRYGVKSGLMRANSIAYGGDEELDKPREDRSTLPIENQSFVSSGEGVFIPAFSFPGFDSIPGVLLAKHRPKFPTALRGLLAKPLLKQDR